MAKSDLAWKSVNVDAFSKPLLAKYEALREANAKAREARAEFELAFTQAARAKKLLSDKQDFAFGYRFGRLAIAFVDKTAAKATKAKSDDSFSL